MRISYAAVIGLSLVLAPPQVPTPVWTPLVPEEAEPPTTQRWYTHAEGDYRFPLPDSWQELGPDDAVDILLHEQDRTAMFVRRTSLALGDSDPLATMDRLTRDMLGGDSEPTTWRGTIGDGDAVFAQAFDDRSQQMFWHVFFHHAGKVYYIGLASAPKADPDAKFPTDVLVMLKGIEFLN